MVASLSSFFKVNYAGLEAQNPQTHDVDEANKTLRSNNLHASESLTGRLSTPLPYSNTSPPKHSNLAGKTPARISNVKRCIIPRQHWQLAISGDEKLATLIKAIIARGLYR